MGKPYHMNCDDPERKRGKHTVGSKTFQYHEENKPIGISLVAASESE
jgi:hypothetical protein